MDRLTLSVLAGCTALAVVLLALLWWGLSALPVTALKMLTMTLVIGLPTALWVGWRLGNRESRAALHGVDEVAVRVMDVAERVASLRVNMRSAMPEPPAPPPTQAVATLPPFIYRTLPSGNDDVVDL